MTDVPSRLEEIGPWIWDRCGRSVHRPADPWRTPVIAATDGLGGVSARIVVLRGLDPDRRLLRFHTDARSAKVRSLERNSRLAWVFYDPSVRVQVRAVTQARLLREGPAVERAWSALTEGQRRLHAGGPVPGTVLADADVPADLAGEDSTDGDGVGRHFLLVEACVMGWDWLWLGPDRHRRAGLDWDGEVFRASWLVP